jgi:hypothetical protein
MLTAANQFELGNTNGTLTKEKNIFLSEEQAESHPSKPLLVFIPDTI